MMKQIPWLDEKLKDPEFREAFDRYQAQQRTDKQRRAALKTFCRAMKRYEKRAKAFGMRSFTVTLAMVREDVPRMDDKDMLEEEEVQLRRMAIPRDTDHMTPRGVRSAPLFRFLCERAAETVAKLRAAVEP